MVEFCQHAVFRAPKTSWVAPRLSGHSNRGTSFCVREDGEERTRWFRSTARRGTRRRSFKAKVPLRTRLISHGHASHIADETRWTQTWHDHTFVGTNVPDRGSAHNRTPPFAVDTCPADTAVKLRFPSPRQYVPRGHCCFDVKS